MTYIIILLIFLTVLFEFTVIKSHEPIISKVVKENASKYGNIKTNFCLTKKEGILCIPSKNLINGKENYKVYNVPFLKDEKIKPAGFDSKMQ